MRRGVIVIPTYRRPRGLDKALSYIEKLETTANVTVLVADNDPEAQEGTEIVRRLAAAGYRFPIRSIVVAERGVSQVRNASIASALETPGTEFVALLDDDEWPEPQWLEAMLDMQHKTGADAVGGTMLPAFAVAPPPWTERLTLYRQEQADGLTEMLWGTCNVLLTRRYLEKLSQPWFDAEFGLTGGEDVEFFTRAKARGASFAWASAARVFEHVPQSRMTMRWVARRSFRIGNTNALTQLRWRYRRLGRLVIFVKSIGRLFAAAMLILPNSKSNGRIIEAMCLSSRSLGEVAALFGIRYREYG
jgi:succinoglycan biosynthesis protein ExoM